MSAKKPVPRAGAFSPLVMIALIVVSVFSFSAFFTLSAFAPELTSGHDGRAHALSQSASGYAGIVKLTKARGDWVTVERSQNFASPPELLLITPEHPLTRIEINGLAASSFLIVLPKWLVMPSARHPGWVQRVDAAPPEAVASLLGEIAPNAVVQRRSGDAQPTLHFAPLAAHEDEDGNTVNETTYADQRAGYISQAQTITAPGLTPIVTDDAGHIVLGELPANTARVPVYVLADPDFLNTQGIASVDTARAGLALLDRLHNPEDELGFDVTLNGFAKARSVLRMLFEPPFLPATLCLFAAACLLGWRAAIRTGPSVKAARAIALGKSALADNSAALIRIAGREHKMGAGYAALTANTVADLIGAARKADEETTALLDSVGARQGVSARYSDLAAEAKAAHNPARMLDAAKKLRAWKEEMLRAAG